MKRYAILGMFLFGFLAYSEAEAGTLRLKTGEVLSFNSEKEFVEMLLEEFLPPDLSGKTGYFIVSDSSTQKENLRVLLTQPETLDLQEHIQTALYPSIQGLSASQEYQDTIASIPKAAVFAVEVSFDELDMIFVYTIETSQTTRNLEGTTRGTTRSSGKAYIDARGEGHFEFIEE